MNEHNFSVPLANNDSLQGMLWTNDDNPKFPLKLITQNSSQIVQILIGCALIKNS